MHEDFLKKRRNQEDEHFKISKDHSVLNSLVVIEINLTELCNRNVYFVLELTQRSFQIEIYT